MALIDIFNFAAVEGGDRSDILRRRVRLTATAGALVLGSLVPSPAGSQPAATFAENTLPPMPAAATCKWGPVTKLHRDSGIEPQLLIDGTCRDPDYNEKTFVIEKVEHLTYQVPGGPLIPYTQVTGHFPVLVPEANLPRGIRLTPKISQQNYIWKFPAKEFWKNRSMQVQHPQSGGNVDNRLAFTNGAFSVNWLSGNSVATNRHHAAATKLAKAYANRLYGNSAHIYSYYWGLSGGGVVATAAAENTTGVWDAVQIQMSGIAAATHHTRMWEGLYQMAVPEAKRAAVAAAVQPGSGLDIYAGLDEDEKSVLNELLGGGSPRALMKTNYSLTPIVHPVEFRLTDPTYEDDFWSKPGYAGANPPNYLKAALVDGMATVTGITRDAAGVPTAVQFDPATVPRLGTIGDANLQFYVMSADGKTHIIDPALPPGSDFSTTARPLTNRRYSLVGNLNIATGTLTLATNPVNNAYLLNALKVGGKVRVNNRYMLSMYYYPRYTIQPGLQNYAQYKNPDGSFKYPQRVYNSIPETNLRTMGGRVESGDIKTKTMVMTNEGDPASWALLNTSYSEIVQKKLGPDKSEQMFRVYFNNNGCHCVSGEIAGIFRQSLIDMIAWAEKGIPPKPSSHYTIVNGQPTLAPEAKDRHGLQPVINITANGSDRAVVGVNQPVNLAAKLEMPPETGMIVRYSWNLGSLNDAPTVVAKPQPLVNVTRTVSFSAPGTYFVRINVDGQRDGLADPYDQTLVQNFKDVRVVVEAPPAGGRGGRGGGRGGGGGGRGGAPQ